MSFSLDSAHCYAALQVHDPGYDGLFFVGVSTTRIYCRPVCRVRLPQADRCTFYASAAHAEQDGYRPCLRCRPELAPGSFRANALGHTSRSAAEQIRTGLLAHSNTETLMDMLELRPPQFHQIIEREYGVNATELETTQRLLLAKQLFTDTTLKINDIAHVCGFANAHHLDDAFSSRYRLNPLSLRKKHPDNEDNTLLLRLSYRPPLAWDALIRFLCSRSNPRLSQIQNGAYLQTIDLDGCRGWIIAKQAVKQHQIQVQVSPSLLPCLAKLQVRLRRLFDLDACPALVDAHLGDDAVLKPLVANYPGLRIPGTLDIFELGLRAILGQQITVKAATTLFSRFVAAFGKEVETPFPGLDRTRPSADAIAAAPLQTLIDIGLTGRRAQTVQQFAHAVVDGTLKPESVHREKITERLLELPGIGPWTAQYIAMRALGDSNAFPASDLGLLRGLQVEKTAELLHRTEKWQPWRAYGAIHLWHQCAGG